MKLAAPLQQRPGMHMEHSWVSGATNKRKQDAAGPNVLQTMAFAATGCSQTTRSVAAL